MTVDKFNQQYRIPSARATWHDYSGGMYFVTACTTEHHYLFGDIIDGQLRLNRLGECVVDNLRNVTEHYSYAEIPLFVVMPNHFHAIILIRDSTKSEGNGVSELSGNVETVCTPSPQQPSTNVETVCTPSAQQSSTNVETVCTPSPYPNSHEILQPFVAETVCTPSLHETRWKTEQVNTKMQSISLRKGRLPVVIGGIKRAVTRFAHQHNITFAWQPRFHDHIIRHYDECNRIAEYIETNVAKWHADRYNKENK